MCWTGGLVFRGSGSSCCWCHQAASCQCLCWCGSGVVVVCPLLWLFDSECRGDLRAPCRGQRDRRALVGPGWIAPGSFPARRRVCCVGLWPKARCGGAWSAAKFVAARGAAVRLVRAFVVAMFQFGVSFVMSPCLICSRSGVPHADGRHPPRTRAQPTCARCWVGMVSGEVVLRRKPEAQAPGSTPKVACILGC